MEILLRLSSSSLMLLLSTWDRLEVPGRIQPKIPRNTMMPGQCLDSKEQAWKFCVRVFATEGMYNAKFNQSNPIETWAVKKCNVRNAETVSVDDWVMMIALYF